MHRLGYEHQGFSVGYSDMSQIRWHSVLNLQQKSEDQLLKEMSYQTRCNINKTFEMGVEVITLPIEETDRFYRLFKMAEENMALISEKSHTLKKCKRFIMTMDILN